MMVQVVTGAGTGRRARATAVVAVAGLVGVLLTAAVLVRVATGGDTQATGGLRLATAAPVTSSTQRPSAPGSQRSLAPGSQRPPAPGSQRPPAPGSQQVRPGASFRRHVPTQAERLRARTQQLAKAAAAQLAANPLTGHGWGVYRGSGDQAWAPYDRASGRTKDALARIALTPKAKWFGDWIGNDRIESNIRDYIANAQAGDPDTLVQLALFRMVPWEAEACRRLPSGGEQASYKDWIDRAARAIGDTPAAVILQPDGPFAMCVPGGSTLPSELIGYASKVLSALSHTSVYIDAGAGDWPAVGQGGVDAAVRFLLPAGIEYARGIALNSTHYSATELEVARGAAIVQALDKLGIRDKHVVVNTSSNGHPFEFGRYDGADPDNARVCRTATDPGYCVTLGIPPTTQVADPRWGLDATTDDLARTYVDAYLWFGRPWLYRQADPFQLDRALGLVASSPY